MEQGQGSSDMQYIDDDALNNNSENLEIKLQEYCKFEKSMGGQPDPQQHIHPWHARLRENSMKHFIGSIDMNNEPLDLSKGKSTDKEEFKYSYGLKRKLPSTENRTDDKEEFKYSYGLKRKLPLTENETNDEENFENLFILAEVAGNTPNDKEKFKNLSILAEVASLFLQKEKDLVDKKLI